MEKYINPYLLLYRMYIITSKTDKESAQLAKIAASYLKENRLKYVLQVDNLEFPGNQANK